MISDREIAALIESRKLFPCFFGSALHGDGVEALLDAISVYAPVPAYGETFGARVFKITRDAQGGRLTHVRVTGGRLQVKQIITSAGKKESAGAAADDGEKIDQIRLYSGERHAAVQAAEAGSICALLGPEHTFCGQGLGAEQETAVSYTHLTLPTSLIV